MIYIYIYLSILFFFSFFYERMLIQVFKGSIGGRGGPGKQRLR